MNKNKKAISILQLKHAILYSICPEFEYKEETDCNVAHKYNICYIANNNYNDIVYISDSAPELKDILLFILHDLQSDYDIKDDLLFVQLTHHGQYFWDSLKDKVCYYSNDNDEPFIYKNKIVLANNEKIKLNDNLSATFYSFDTCLYCEELSTTISDIREYTKAKDNNCHVILEYFISILEISQELGLKNIEINLPTIGRQYVINRLSAGQNQRQKSKTLQEFRGQTNYGTFLKNKKNGKKTYYCNLIKEEDAISDYIISKCWHGGNNTAYTRCKYNCADDEIVLDIDLKSAYPTAFCSNNNANYSLFKRTCYNEYISSFEELPKDIQTDLTNDNYCFCNIKYSFNNDVIYPSLPSVFEMKSDKGILYLLNGSCYCTGSELLATLELFKGRVKIKIVDLVVVPQTNENIFTFIFEDLLNKRAFYKQNNNKLLELAVKLITNSIYGNIAQGLKEDSAQEQGKISNNIYASSATGLIRACIITLINILAKHDFKIISATTDGITVVAKRLHLDNEIKEDIRYYIKEDILSEIERSSAFQKFIKGYRASGKTDNNYLQVKHIGNSVSCYRSKVQIIRLNEEVQYKICSPYMIDSAQEVDDIFNSDKFTTIAENHTSSIKSVRKKIHACICNYLVDKTINNSDDIKRVYISNSLYSEPFASLKDVIKAERYIYYNKKEKNKPTTNNLIKSLLSRKENYNVKYYTQKQIVKAIAQRVGIFADDNVLTIKKDTDIIKALDLMNLCGIKDFSNMKIRKDINGRLKNVFKSNTILDTAENRKIIFDIATKLNIDSKHLDSIYRLVLAPFQNNSSV